MGDIQVHDAEIAGLPVRWRTAPGADPPILWLHGVPQSSEMWALFLERAGGVAVDLPGFGRSGKPAGFDYSIAGYTRFLETFLDHLGLARVRLAMHDWGAVGLAFAQAHPERVERLAAIDVVPFLTGYRWHRVARLWRAPVAGELAMGFTGRGLLRRATGLPDRAVDEVMEHFDHGTQRAILKLYRSAPPVALAAAGAQLGRVSAPALVVWGERDPFIPARFADALGSALADARVERLADAGHWPWLDRPEAVELIAGLWCPLAKHPATEAPERQAQARRLVGETRACSQGQPHRRFRMRLPALIACSAVVCALALPALRPPSADAASIRMDRTELKIIRLVNHIRARHGLRRLAVSRALAAAATVHSGDMLRRDFFGHGSSDGTPMSARVHRYTRAHWLGENLAIVSGRGSTAQRVVLMWMRSPAHRRVLLSRRSRRIGVGKRTGRVGQLPGAVYTADFASLR